MFRYSFNKKKLLNWYFAHKTVYTTIQSTLIFFRTRFCTQIALAFLKYLKRRTPPCNFVHACFPACTFGEKCKLLKFLASSPDIKYRTQSGWKIPAYLAEVGRIWLKHSGRFSPVAVWLLNFTSNRSDSSKFNWFCLVDFPAIVELDQLCERTFGRYVRT